MVTKTSTVNDDTKSLKNDVKNLKEQNNRLSIGLNSLKDDVIILQTEINNFREMVSTDMKKIVEKIVEKRKRIIS
jgi:molecular chaperone GrpE (heat shock protein)